MMKNTVSMVVAIAALAGGCKKQEGDKAPPVGSGATEVGSGVASGATGSGSAAAAMGSGSGSAVAAGSGSAMAKPLSPAEIQHNFETCWGYFSAGKFADFKGCYADDAQLEAPGMGVPTMTGSQAIIDGAKTFYAGFADLKAELQFEMFSGHTAIGAVLVHGTINGKKVGFYFTHVVETNDAGKIAHEWQFYDIATLMGQMNPNKDLPVRAAIDKIMGAKDVVWAKDDAKEKANLEAFTKFTDAFNKHDVKALDGLLDDKLVWSELAEVKDQAKKDYLGTMPKLWSSFSDLKFTVGKAWAAGDFVAAVESFDGTNDGDGEHMKKTGKKISLPFLAIHKFEGGKNTMTWIVYQNLGFMTQLGMAPPVMPGMGASATGSAGSGSARSPR